jgi:hypothetical protein
MRGTKQVTLPISFQFSNAGKLEEDCMVTLQAPGLDSFSIHNHMVAFAAEAQRNSMADEAAMLQKLGPLLDKILEAKAEQQASEEEPQEIPEEQKAEQVISTYAKGLGSEKFPAFMEYVKKALTNNAKLARVGDTKVPLNDEVWLNIEKAGGMEAATLIIAGFAGFFLKDLADGASTGKSGKSALGSPQSDRAVH